VPGGQEGRGHVDMATYERLLDMVSVESRALFSVGSSAHKNML